MAKEGCDRGTALHGGRFRPGPDPRRHPLTEADRRRGFLGLVRAARRRDATGRIAAYVLDRLIVYLRRTDSRRRIAQLAAIRDAHRHGADVRPGSPRVEARHPFGGRG